MTAVHAMLQALNIHKSIDGHRILSDVSVTARVGEITAIIGPNGAGKSTLLRCLSMVDPPDNGVVIVGDNRYCFPASTTNPTMRPCWPDLTAVFQGLHLWPHMTLRDNILLPASKRGKKPSEGAFKEIIETFDLTGVLSRFPNQASGGERQRAAIARSLFLNPQYLLLDEPTSASDVRHVRSLLQYLQSVRKSGMTVVVVTHLIRFARQLADQVIFMEDGSITTSGPASIIDHPDNDRLEQFLDVF